MEINNTSGVSLPSGDLLVSEGGRDAAIRHAHAAIARAPDDATALALAGFVIAQISHDMPTARKAFEQALTISPSSFIALACGATAVGDAERAIDWSQPEFSVSHLLLTAALAAAGRLDDARGAAALALALQPDFSTRAFCEALAIPLSLAVPFGEALRAAGLPD